MYYNDIYELIAKRLLKKKYTLNFLVNCGYECINVDEIMDEKGLLLVLD